MSNFLVLDIVGFYRQMTFSHPYLWIRHLNAETLEHGNLFKCSEHKLTSTMKCTENRVLILQKITQKEKRALIEINIGKVQHTQVIIS
jgi:hypothetical protein